MLKKIIVFALLTIVIVGCKSQDTDIQSSERQAFTSGFNQETYVWESFLFPTNRTTGVQ